MMKWFPAVHSAKPNHHVYWGSHICNNLLHAVITDVCTTLEVHQQCASNMPLWEDNNSSVSSEANYHGNIVFTILITFVHWTISIADDSGRLVELDSWIYCYKERKKDEEVVFYNIIHTYVTGLIKH